jgi:hypothetical protein
VHVQDLITSGGPRSCCIDVCHLGRCHPSRNIRVRAAISYPVFHKSPQKGEGVGVSPDLAQPVTSFCSQFSTEAARNQGGRGYLTSPSGAE